MIYSIKDRLPRRYDTTRFSVNVLLYDKDGNIEACRIGYCLYEDNVWRIVPVSSSGDESLDEYPYWSYIPEIDVQKREKPIIDGE